MASSPEETDEVRAALADMGLAGSGDAITLVRLSGGVSCDVWRVDLPERSIALKRALPKLRVTADWRAPAERSASEVAWMRLANGIAPGSAPGILGEDHSRHMFAMEFFPPEEYPVWKAELAAGRIDPAFAGKVGRTIARIHAATAWRADIAKAFANDAQFMALRLDPFLLYVAARHADVAETLRRLAHDVAAARIALMHGDVSPKNILCGPDGPVFLDAETTCYGDPAFDLAFCLNHLLLKCAWHPEWRDGYIACFMRLAAGYAGDVAWEDPAAVDARAAALLPALMLARVDGKSPADYLDTAHRQDFVRREAKALLLHAPRSLDAIAQHWSRAATHEFAP